MGKKKRSTEEVENPFVRPTEVSAPVVEPVVKDIKAEILPPKQGTVSAAPRKINEEEDNTMGTVSTEKRFIFYYGFYSVNHALKKGEYMEPLHTKTGETRKCPCNSIAIELDNVYDLVMNGYILKNLDKNLFRNRSITKKNIDDYITYITNMINNGFLKEQ